MQHLLSGIPEPFEKTVTYNTWQPLEDAPMKYWSVRRNGKPVADCESQIWGYPVVNMLLGAYYQDGQAVELAGVGYYDHSRSNLASGAFFHYTWDGLKLTVTLERKEHYENTDMRCGWDAVLVCTPVLDQRLMDLLDKVDYKLHNGPYLENVMRQPLELVALSVADYQHRLNSGMGASLTTDFQKYEPLTAGLTETQKETIIALAGEWKNSAESLAQAARKL